MTMGRKPHEPNDKDRRTVETMAGHGIPVGDIARVIKLSEPTLRKYYGEELDTGQTKANSMVAQSLYQKAMGSGQGAVTACIFWLKVRAGWVERSYSTVTIEKRDESDWTRSELVAIINDAVKGRDDLDETGRRGEQLN